MTDHHEPAPEQSSVPSYSQLIALAEALSKTYMLPMPDEAEKLRQLVDELLSEERKTRITTNLVSAGVIGKRRKFRDL